MLILPAPGSSHSMDFRARWDAEWGSVLPDL